MFTRFRDSLVYPSRIIEYRKDRFIRVFGYMMLFAVVMLSSTVVLLARFDRIPQNVRDMYQENLTENEINCVLDDSVLTCDETPLDPMFYNEAIGMINVSMAVSEDIPDSSQIDALSMSIFFSNDVMYLYYGGVVFEYTYDELPEEFSYIDFSLSTSDPEAFTDEIMDGFGEYVKSIGHIIAPILLISGLIGNILMILFVVFMNSLILKLRFKVIPYKETFKMGVYMGTTLYLLLIVNTFFGLGLFTIILFLILTFRQTNALSLEIMKRMKPKK